MTKKKENVALLLKARLPLHAGQRHGQVIKRGLALFPRDIDPTTPPKSRDKLLLKPNTPLRVETIPRGLGLDKGVEQAITHTIEKRVKQSGTEIQLRKELFAALNGLGHLDQEQRRMILKRSVAYWRSKKARVSPLLKAKTADDRHQGRPAKPSERRTGSKKNPKGSAAGGKKITFNAATTTALENKVKEHNEKVDAPSKKATLRALKAVYRRGAGAFSTSHRPGMQRAQWAMARVNHFLRLLRAGKPKDPKYITDNDLLPSGHPRSTKKSLVLEKAGKYDHISFKPPESVARAAERGLEFRKKASPSNRGGLTPAEAGKHGIGSGVQRAVNLKNRTTMSPKTVRMMNRFFSRHEKNKTINPENRGTPWNDKGYVAWLLWGGDPGQSWARKVVRQMDAADDVKKAEEKPKLPKKITQRGRGDPIQQVMGDSKRALPAGTVRVHFSQDRGGFVRAMKMADGTWKILGKIHKDHEPTGKNAKKTPHLPGHKEHHESPKHGKEPIHTKHGKPVKAKPVLTMGK